MGTAKSRQEKMMWFPFHIHNLYELKQDNSKEKIIAEFCIKYFASKKTAMEIINILVSTEKLIEKDNKLFTFNDWKEKKINFQFKSNAI